MLCTIKPSYFKKVSFFRLQLIPWQCLLIKKVGNQIIEARYIISTFKTDINVIVFHSHSSTVRMFPGKLQIILRKLSGVHIQADT